jgi:DNA-directed RNA polymerase subunit RPC12/RpoP
MKVIKLNCASCGAPISVPEDAEQLNCANCGSHLYLERGEGYYALKAADQISDAIHQSSRFTQDAIREGAQITTIELKRLQLTQALGNAQQSLNSTLAEQRALTRGQMTPAAAKQLRDLHFQEWTQWEEVRHLQMQMDVLEGGPIETNQQALKTQTNMLSHSIKVMKLCPPTPHNQQILQTLIAEKKQYQQYLLDLQADQTRKKLPAFSIKKPFSQDLNTLLKQLHQIQKDQARLAQGGQNPITAKLQSELETLFGQLHEHWYREVHRQSWGGLNPTANPGEDYQKVSQHLSATQSTIKWLSASPTPSKKLKREIRKLTRSERKLTRTHQTLGEQIRFRDALKLLRTSLMAFSITRPFSTNLNAVRGQMKTFQKDMQNLQRRPQSPEVQAAYRELNDRYRTLYDHWAHLERQSLENRLKARQIHPPFNPDAEAARADYQLVCADVRLLKEAKKIPGAETLYQSALGVQRQLYDHLQALAAADRSGSQEGPPPGS